MPESIVRLKDILLDLLFPRRCVGCGREGVYLCGRCEYSIEKNRNPKIFWAGGLGVLAACKYQGDSLIPRLIHQFKYKFSIELAELFAGYIGPPLLSNFTPHEAMLVPVPLHKKRLCLRGFNQAQVLCVQLKKKYGYEWIPLLKRIRPTPPQVSLPRKERLQNLKNAFEIDRRLLPKSDNRTIVIIDDVATTCTTLHECARTLQRNGYRKIIGLVVASGQYDNWHRCVQNGGQ